MIFLWMSAILFGFVHPGSKYILDTGLPLEAFCFLYIGIRLLFQIPLVLKKKCLNIPSKYNLGLLIILGLIGVILQFSEFYGVAAGLNVSTVSFLVYTHPVWTIIFSKILQGEKLDIVKKLKLSLALIGIFFLIHPSETISLNISSYGFPILAGCLIALWVVISNIARKKGVESIQLSFYYDMFAFMFISIACLRNTAILGNFSVFFSNHFNGLFIVFYSLCVGLLPNLLFYKGSASVDSSVAGFILLLEPVISTFFAILIWNESPALEFYFGAFLILLVNLPVVRFALVLKKMRYYLPIALLLVAPTSFGKAFKEIYLMEIIPTNSSEYTVSFEKKQMSIAADLAIDDFKKKNESCQPKLIKLLRNGSEEDLFRSINNLKHSSNRIIVGLSRTNFARAAAKVAQNTNIRAISVGASTANLFRINRNFISIVNPWTKQFELIASSMENLKCSSNNTIGYFDSSNYLSSNFKMKFQSKKLGIEREIEKFHPDKAVKCLFFGVNLVKALPLINGLIKSDWKGTVFGLGDWNINEDELTALSKKLGKNISVIVPTGWKKNISKNSERFNDEFIRISSLNASPLAAYTYDGVMIAANTLCHNEEHFVWKDTSLLKNYNQLTSGGNLQSALVYRLLPEVLYGK